MANKLRSFLLFIMGIVFISGGLAIAYYFGSDIDFTCKRSLNECVLRETDFLGKEKITNTIKLTGFAGAEIIEERGLEDDHTYKVVLITNQGRIPFSKYSSSNYDSHVEKINKINTYVNSFNEYLDVKQSGNLLKITGFVLAGIGCFMLLDFLATVLKLTLMLFIMVFKKFIKIKE